MHRDMLKIQDGVAIVEKLNSHAQFELDGVAQTVEHDASNIKVMSSILSAVKLFFHFFG